MMDHDAAYTLALGIIHAEDRGFAFESWTVEGQMVSGEEFYKWAILFITPPEGSGDGERAYGKRKIA